MLKILPSPFRLREWILTVAALASAIAALLFSDSFGLGAGGVLFVSVIVGTVMFVATSGRHRAFFTGLFTSALFAALVVRSTVDSIFVRHESLSRDHWLLPIMLFLFYVLIPVVFAWLVTFVICRMERVSKHDDHTA